MMSYVQIVLIQKWSAWGCKENEFYYRKKKRQEKMIRFFFCMGVFGKDRMRLFVDYYFSEHGFTLE